MDKTYMIVLSYWSIPLKEESVKKNIFNVIFLNEQTWKTNFKLRIVWVMNVWQLNS